MLTIIIVIENEETCPEGFKIHLGGGDIPGPGLVDLRGTYYNLKTKNMRNIPNDQKRCASICKDNNKCKAFMHSKELNDCKLLAYSNPTVPGKVEPDYIFCKREGEFNFNLQHNYIYFL